MGKKGLPDFCMNYSWGDRLLSPTNDGRFFKIDNLIPRINLRDNREEIIISVTVEGFDLHI